MTCIVRPPLSVWNLAWEERRKAFGQSGDVVDLVPNYIAEHPGELEQLVTLRNDLLSRFATEARSVWEFGCGSGYHLVDLALHGETHHLVGLDYSVEALKCIEAANDMLGLYILTAPFDLLKAKPAYPLPCVAVLTSGALEQVGTGFIPFVDYLLEKRPYVVINIEPLYELYDENNPKDRLAAEYTRKRDYLRGYLPYLQQLEREGTVEILETKRGFGSLNHIGHSHVVWRPT